MSVARDRVTPRIETPAGILSTSFTIDGEPAPRTATQGRVLDGGGLLFTYQTARVRAELLAVSLLGQGDVAGVKGSIGTMWRLATWEDLESLTFECRWLAVPRDAQACPMPGRNGEVSLWTERRTAVAIGAENADIMRARARCGDGVPVRFRDHIDESVVRYLDDGLGVVMPPLARHEQCQVQFIVAWGGAGSQDEVWHEALRSSNDLLRAADLT